MSKIKVISKTQSSRYTIDGITLTIKEGVNEIPVSFWVGFKEKNKKKIDGHYILPAEPLSEDRLISEFKNACLSEFESMGVPAVKVSSTQGLLSKGVKHTLALEWLESKSELRETSREDREEESLSISRNAVLIAEAANRLARIAIILSAITAIIAAIAIYFK